MPYLEKTLAEDKTALLYYIKESAPSLILKDTPAIAVKDLDITPLKLPKADDIFYAEDCNLLKLLPNLDNELFASSAFNILTLT